MKKRVQFNHPSDIYPQMLMDIWRRNAAIDPDWIEWEDSDERPEAYVCRPKASIPKGPLSPIVQCGGDWFAMWAASRFISDGPKVFRPTLEQCLALEKIDVNLEISDYSQPFPTLLVDFPRDYDCGPFDNVLCFNPPKLLILSLNDCPTHGGDIVTTIRQDGRPIEVSLRRYDPDCADKGPDAARALRVAINSCLALSNFGCRLGWLLPDDVERDQRFAKEKSERGERARQRMPLHAQKVSFEREVVLHRTEGRDAAPGEPTGAEKAPHWRRGHWAMQACGVGRAERKRILRPPVLVRKDRLLPGESVQTVYRT